MPSQEEVRSLVQAIKGNPAIPEALKKEVEDTLAAGFPIYQTDIWIYRLIVVVLGLTVLLTVIGGLGLAFIGSPQNYKMPTELVALGSAAVGALAGMLAPSPREVKS